MHRLRPIGPCGSVGALAYTFRQRCKPRLCTQIRGLSEALLVSQVERHPPLLAVVRVRLRVLRVCQRLGCLIEPGLQQGREAGEG